MHDAALLVVYVQKMSNAAAVVQMNVLIMTGVRIKDVLLKRTFLIAICVMKTAKRDC